MIKYIFILFLFIQVSYPIEINLGISDSWQDVEFLEYDGYSLQSNNLLFPTVGIGIRIDNINASNKIASNIYLIRKGSRPLYTFRGSNGDIISQWSYYNYCYYMSTSLILMHYFIPEHDNVNFSIGPRVDIAIHRSEIAFGITPTDVQEQIFQKEFHKFDWGLDLGLEYRYKRWSIEYRYSYNISFSSSSKQLELKNYSQQLVLGVLTNTK